MFSGLSSALQTFEFESPLLRSCKVDEIILVFLLFSLFPILIIPALQRMHRENYVFLQVGFQHLAYELREDVPSYGTESLFGKCKPCFAEALNQRSLRVCLKYNCG